MDGQPLPKTTKLPPQVECLEISLFGIHANRVQLGIREFLQISEACLVRIVRYSPESHVRNHPEHERFVLILVVCEFQESALQPAQGCLSRHFPLLDRFVPWERGLLPWSLHYPAIFFHLPRTDAVEVLWLDITTSRRP